LKDIYFPITIVIFVVNSGSQLQRLKVISMRHIFTLLATVLAITCTIHVSALDNGLGRTPQLGWNSWNRFACNINETVVRQTADLIVSKGLDKFGYKYVCFRF
jgi:hypothetical protein